VYNCINYTKDLEGTVSKLDKTKNILGNSLLMPCLSCQKNYVPKF